MIETVEDEFHCGNDECPECNDEPRGRFGEGVEAGRNEERSKVAAWLRFQNLSTLAEAIEALEHRKVYWL